MHKIGVDMGGTTVKLGVVQDGQTIVYRDTRPSPKDAKSMAALIVRMILGARKRYPAAEIGISCAGAIDPDGYIEANQLGFHHEPLGAMIFEGVGERIPMENDGVCAMIAEYAAGALRGTATALMITLGTGIGGGVILNGKPLKGYQGRAAELGHMITHVDGRHCSCSQTGCWEAYASGTALRRLCGGLPVRDIIGRVEKGELQQEWHAYIHELAHGLIGLCQIFCPERIAIGGGLSNAGSLLLDDLTKELNADPGYRKYQSHVRLVLAEFLNDAGILGAAALTCESSE